MTKVKRTMFNSPLRLINIATGQIRALRTRIVVNYYINNPGTGCYFQIGNSVKKILDESKADYSNIDLNTCLSNYYINKVYSFPTTLKRITNNQFEIMFKHGFEVANATLLGRLNQPWIKMRGV